MFTCDISSLVTTNTSLQNKKPSGADTANVARPKLSNVLYGGAGIYDCVNDGQIALTFDDGPYIYTNDLLDKLKVRTTSFLVYGRRT